MTLLINAGKNGAEARGDTAEVSPRCALQGTRNTRKVRERHTLWTFVTREAGRYTRSRKSDCSLPSSRFRSALIFIAAEALSLSLSLLGRPTQSLISDLSKGNICSRPHIRGYRETRQMALSRFLPAISGDVTTNHRVPEADSQVLARE